MDNQTINTQTIDQIVALLADLKDRKIITTQYGHRDATQNYTPARSGERVEPGVTFYNVPETTMSYLNYKAPEWQPRLAAMAALLGVNNGSKLLEEALEKLKLKRLSAETKTNILNWVYDMCCQQGRNPHEKSCMYVQLVGGYNSLRRFDAEPWEPSVGAYASAHSLIWRTLHMTGQDKSEDAVARVERDLGVSAALYGEQVKLETVHKHIRAYEAQKNMETAFAAMANMLRDAGVREFNLGDVLFISGKREDNYRLRWAVSGIFLETTPIGELEYSDEHKTIVEELIKIATVRIKRRNS